MIEFTVPKVLHHGYDTSKDWYIYFRARNPVTGQVKLFRFKKGINRYHKKTERIKEANALRLAIENMLSDGYNPFTKNHTDLPENYLQESLKNILDVKRSSLKPKSIRTYNDIVNMFNAWLNGKGWSRMPAGKFTRKDALQYADYLLKYRKFSGKSYNHNLGVLKTFFNAMVTREIITVNPFKGIADLPEGSSSHTPYSDIERAKIIDYLKRYNIRLYYAISFIFYCFIRRSELVRLRVRDINMNNYTITIPSEVSKNRKTESVTIPRQFEKVIKAMHLENFNQDDYIFGHKYQTCSRKIIRPDSMSAAIARVNREVGITGNKSLYSFKHSGVVELYNATKDPVLCMHQCRHGDLKTTLIYLRSLGLTVDQGVRRADFKM